MIAEWQFTKAVDEFKKVLREESLMENINDASYVDESYNRLNEYVRSEFKDFAAVPDSQRVIMDQLRDYRNWKKQNEDGFGYVNTQRNHIIALVKNYLNDVGVIQHFKAVAW